MPVIKIIANCKIYNYMEILPVFSIVCSNFTCVKKGFYFCRFISRPSSPRLRQTGRAGCDVALSRKDAKAQRNNYLFF